MAGAGPPGGGSDYTGVIRRTQASLRRAEDARRMGMPAGVGHNLVSGARGRSLRRIKARVGADAGGLSSDRCDVAVDPVSFPKTETALTEACQTAEHLAALHLQRLRGLVGENSRPSSLRLAFEATLGILRDGYYLANSVAIVTPDAALRESARSRGVDFLLRLDELMMDAEVYQTVRALLKSGAGTRDDRAWLMRTERAMYRAGAAVIGSARAPLLQWKKTLAEKGAQYERNLQSRQEQARWFQPDALAGLPPEELAWRLEGAPGTRYSGQVRIVAPRDLDLLLRYAHDERVRRWAWRAQQSGAVVNAPVFFEILRCRQTIARLIGGRRANWADLALSETSLGSFSGAERAIAQMERAIKRRAPRAEARLLAEKRRGQSAHQLHPDAVMPWDRDYLQRRIDEGGLTQEEKGQVRQLLELEWVLTCMTGFLSDLFRIQLVRQSPELGEGGRTFTVQDRRSRRVLGRVHLDLRARPGKRVSAYTFAITGGREDYTLTEVGITASFASALQGKTFLDSKQVVELFHELGHVLNALRSGQSKSASLTWLDRGMDDLETPGMLFEKLATHPQFLERLFHRFDQDPSPRVRESLRHAFESVRGLEWFRRDLFWSAFYLAAHGAEADEVEPDVLWAKIAERQEWPHPVPIADHLISPHFVFYGPSYVGYLSAKLNGSAVYRAGHDRRSLLRFSDRYMRGSERSPAALLRAHLGGPVDFEAQLELEYEEEGSEEPWVPRSPGDIADRGRMANRVAVARLEVLQRRLASSMLEPEELLEACRAVLKPLDDALLEMTEVEMRHPVEQLRSFARHWGEVLAMLAQKVLDDPQVFPHLEKLAEGGRLDDRLFFWVSARRSEAVRA